MTGEVYVTGASGFIGQALVAALSRRGVATVAVCRRPARFDDVRTLRLSDYSTLEGSRDATLVHLAECRDIGAVDAAPARSRERACELVRRLLVSPWRHAVYVSSSAVFARRSPRPRAVDETPDGEGGYAEVKQRCERHFLEAGHAVARLSNVYGPGMASSNVVSDILSQIPGDGPLGVRDARAVIDPLWIDDAAEGIADVAVQWVPGVFHLAGTAVTVAALARCALERAGEPARRLESRAAAGLPAHRLLARDDSWGWRPRTGLTQGLSTLLEERR